jgi:hypothetical protein
MDLILSRTVVQWQTVGPTAFRTRRALSLLPPRSSATPGMVTAEPRWGSVANPLECWTNRGEWKTYDTGTTLRLVNHTRGIG